MGHLICYFSTIFRVHHVPMGLDLKSHSSSFFGQNVDQPVVKGHNNNDNNWNLYSAISIHKMLKSAAHCHSLSHSQQRLNGRA